MPAALVLAGCEMAKSPAAESPAAAGVAAAPAGVADGRDLWVRYCSACHGVDGQGTAIAMRNFDRTWRAERPDSAIRAIIVAGVPGTTMAPWGTQLRPDELDALVTYIGERAAAR